MDRAGGGAFLHSHSLAKDRMMDAENSLEKIKKQLSSGSGRFLLQGPLLKRSETLRKWNERWVVLDPTTGKMEYRTRRNDVIPKGIIIFDANSTITLSPVNFHGLTKYDGCCFYIGTPQKKEYFLCAETPGAAKAWVSTLRATQLVLKTHKEAVNSLGGNGTTMMGTVAAAVAAANSTAKESAKEIDAAMQISMKAALGAVTNQVTERQMDNMTIMKETLRVKDEELHQLARDLRARDATVKELAEKLSETAAAAHAAASAAKDMDNERKAAAAELQRLAKEKDEIVTSMTSKVKDLEEKFAILKRENENLGKQRDSAMHEAQLWRGELAKARERAVIMEAALVRAEERTKFLEADAETRMKEAIEKQMEVVDAKDHALKEVSRLKLELQRLQLKTLMREQTINPNTEESGSRNQSTEHEIPTACQPDTASGANDSGDMPIPCVTMDVHQTMNNDGNYFNETRHSTMASSQESYPSEGQLILVEENHEVDSTGSIICLNHDNEGVDIDNETQSTTLVNNSKGTLLLNVTSDESDSSPSSQPKETL